MQGFQQAEGVSFACIIEGDVPSTYPDADRINHATDAMLYMEDVCPYMHDENGKEIDLHWYCCT